MRRVSVLERAMSMSNGTDCSVLPGQVVKNEQKNNNNSNGIENNNVADEKDNKQEDFK
jgi:hypothetical protein